MGSGLSIGEYIKKTSYTNLTDNNIKNDFHLHIHYICNRFLHSDIQEIQNQLSNDI